MHLESENSCNPRICNTGVGNTYESGLRSLVDWVGLTLKNVQSLHDICDILGIEFEKFSEDKKGGLGYKKCIRFGEIRIFYDGSEGMGIHIEMSGQGCREFELYTKKDWSMFFALLQNFECNITRLDLAVDDFDNYLSLKTLENKLKRGEVRSKFRHAKVMTKISIADGSENGKTLYFGSEQSEIRVRFYDKLEERKGKGYELEEGLTHWVRAEVQLRNDRAKECAFIIANQYEDVGQVVKGILANYMAFCIKGNDTNKSRWKVARFWTKFLSDVEKLKLSHIAPDRTIEKSIDWIFKQVSPTIATIFEAKAHDPNFLQNVIDDGYSKLTLKHLDMIERYTNKKESSCHEDSKVYEI